MMSVVCGATTVTPVLLATCLRSCIHCHLPNLIVGRAKLLAKLKFMATYVSVSTVLAVGFSMCSSQAQLTVTDDLVLWLQADQLVATNDLGQVTFWADSSGWDNSATSVTPEESPVWVPATINGQPVIHADNGQAGMRLKQGHSLRHGRFVDVHNDYLCLSRQFGRGGRRLGMHRQAGLAVQPGRPSVQKD